MEELLDEKWYVADILEDAYIGARYLPRRYGEREYREATAFVDRLAQCLGI